MTDVDFKGRLKAAVASILFDYTDAHAAAVEKFVDAHDDVVITNLIDFLEKHFSRTTMQARMAEGPLLDTLRNMKPDIEADIDSGIENSFGSLETYLLGVKKAGGL